MRHRSGDSTLRAEVLRVQGLFRIRMIRRGITTAQTVAHTPAATQSTRARRPSYELLAGKYCAAPPRLSERRSNCFPGALLGGSPWPGRREPFHPTGSRSEHAVREARVDGPGRVPDLPGLHEFRLPDPGPHQWTLDAEVRSYRRALDAGITFFDTANVYSDGTSEEIVGRALAEFARRDEIVIATKVYGVMHDGPNGCGLSRKAVMTEIDNSLRRLGTDYVDLYQIHRIDPATPVEETMEALHDVVKAARPVTSGRVRCTRGSSPRPSTRPG